MRTLALVLCSFLILAPVAPASAQNKDEAPIRTSLDLAGALFREQIGSLARSRVWKWLRGEWGAPDPNRVMGADRNTFMHFAATNRLEFLREAVRLGGDCNRRNVHGATPLHFAATQMALAPGPESLRVLMRCEAGAGVAGKCGRGGERGESCRADPNARDRNGETPLHALYVGVVRPSLPGAMTVNLQATGVAKAASEGTGGGRTDVLGFLLSEARADPNVKNAKGDTPLMLLVRHTGALFTKLGHASLLLGRGADPNTRNREGETPLFEALSLHGHSRNYDYDMKNLIALLIKHGADPDMRDAKGDTPLIRAAKHGDDIHEEMKALLAGGADPCLRDRSGKMAYDHTLDGSAGRALLDEAGAFLDRHTGICYRYLLQAEAGEKKQNLGEESRRRIQACLKKRGFEPGPADGRFGSRTRGAIRAWQKREGRKGAEAAGYLASGEAEALLAECRSAAPEPLCAGKAGAGCWMEYADRRGCYTWNPNPQPEETVTWSGRCVNGRASGRGKRVWRYRKDGAWESSSGEGGFRDGHEHGRWILRFADGTVSEGAYAAGKRSGHWIVRGADGKTWEGVYAGRKLQGFWVGHGAGEPEHECWENGEKVDTSACLATVEGRAMELAASARMRHGPGDAFSRKANLSIGDKVKVKAEAGEWALVETPGGGTGFVRKSALRAAALAPEPRCVFGRDIFSESEMEFWSRKRKEGRNPEEVDKEIFKRGVRYDNCWQEVANKPGCYIFHGVRIGKRKYSWAYISAAHVPRPSIRWSGKCVSGVVHGKGDVVYDDDITADTDMISPFSESGGKNAVYVDGKRHGRSSNRAYRGGRTASAEGEWVKGLRQGKWVYTSPYTGKIIENYLDGWLHGLQCKGDRVPSLYQHGVFVGIAWTANCR